MRELKKWESHGWKRELQKVFIAEFCFLVCMHVLILQNCPLTPLSSSLTHYDPEIGRINQFSPWDFAAMLQRPVCLSIVCIQVLKCLQSELLLAFVFALWSSWKCFIKLECFVNICNLVLGNFNFSISLLVLLQLITMLCQLHLSHDFGDFMVKWALLCTFLLIFLK